MDYELEHSRIEQRNRELQKVGAETQEEEIHSLQKEEFNVSKDFNAVIEKPVSGNGDMKQKTRTSMKFLQWFAVIAISSALGAIGYFVYQFLDPSGRPSEQNIVFSIEAPSGANPGELVDIKLKVQNKNNVALDGVEATIFLPTSSYEQKEFASTTPVREHKTTLGIINAGETAEYDYKAYLLGGEQELKTIKSQLSYRFINMNPRFVKDTTADIRILSSPVTVTVDTLKKATAGREINTTITVRSNTEVPLKDVLLIVEYPNGFVYSDAEPRPVIGNGLWVIPKLERSDTAKFEIKGMFSSEGAAERVIRTQVGVSDITTPNEIASKYQEVLTPISLESPFVNIKTTYNSKSPENVTARYGVRMSGEVVITNNTNARISHGTVDVKVTGTGLDENTVDANSGGIYRAKDNTITWDERSVPRLESLGPNESVSLSFSFVPDAGRNNGQYAANPEISTNVLVKAQRENDQGVISEVRTLSASSVKVATQAEFAARALYYSGAIKNHGEIPPKVDKETQFTVVWNLRNTSNTLETGEVRASLPPSVSWASVISPQKENVKYDNISHEIIWNIGTIPAGTGVGSVPPREVSFQVVLTPTLNDVNTYPILLKDQVFRARDSFTKKNVEIRKGEINTQLQYDTKAKRDDGRVVKN